MKEIWKDVIGFEGSYEVSSLGNVRSKSRIVVGRDGITQRVAGVDMRASKINSGYLIVRFRKDGKRLNKLVHRIVAETFIPNPMGFEYVNHIDEDKCNNRVDNLEWCTPRYNVNYGRAKAKLSASHLNHPRLSSPVLMFGKNNSLLQRFPSIHEASRITGISDAQICRCARGERYYHSAGGYIWKYA